MPEVFRYEGGTGRSQGGLFDVALHPDFERNGLVYLSLSKDYNRRLGGLDAMAANVVWTRLKEETPGLHMVRYAKVGPAETVAHGVRRFVLDVEGEQLEVDLVQQTY